MTTSALFAAVVRASQSDAWTYVITGWLLTGAVVAGYWLRTRARIRVGETRLSAERDQ